MSKFESSVKAIAYPQENVYRMLSDFTNIERVRDRIPEDKLQDLSFDQGQHQHQYRAYRCGIDAHRRARGTEDD